ncbi:cytochrome P450 [Fodinicola acaciae]|uniref:cytochrome P450 n=1 Tax=Fodinicola acaciae TaxID=2681555 RepID=UPI0013D31938|nr:cytochrome P450 [Fodinicola acaciae]
MPALLVAIAVLLLVVSLPWWLPKIVISLRVRIFARINGPDGVLVPGPEIGIEHFRQLYAHPAANGRSRGAALSDLFWYWLAPGPQVHQEHLEPGARYDDVARTTRKILARPKGEVERVLARVVRDYLGELAVTGARTVRLRELMMPIWADFYHQLVFEKPATAHTRKLIVDNANDVITALKCTGLRHMDVRDRLTRFLREAIDNDDIPHPLPAALTPEEQAWFLQGTFFNTAIVQMSEAMTHLFLVLARNPEIQERLRDNPDDDRYLDHVMDETFRSYPLFGIAHRITTDDIAVTPELTLPAGTVLCFSYADFHASGFENPHTFDPDRWNHLSARTANHIPFGVTQNRPCPAKGIAPLTMRVVVREMLAAVRFHSSATHVRSIPNRGPCVLVPVEDRAKPVARLAAQQLRDRAEDVTRSVSQLFLGTYMVWDARRQRLTGRYFADHETAQSVGGHE